MGERSGTVREVRKRRRRRQRRRAWAVVTALFLCIMAADFLGGFLVDKVFEPVMALQKDGSILVRLFGSGPGRMRYITTGRAMPYRTTIHRMKTGRRAARTRLRVVRPCRRSVLTGSGICFW